ncbi:zinc-ribbon domain-containing protein [Gordonia paraffinivorans]|uniref:zinc-ribbon domain-containing protein n=1 Tax=Gordonia paraffinivorans TaxID=175628 RepID=UPI003C6CD32A
MTWPRSIPTSPRSGIRPRTVTWTHPGAVMFGTPRRVWWLGECSHEWEAKVLERVKGTGCPYCAGGRVLPVSMTWPRSIPASQRSGTRPRTRASPPPP